MREDENEVCPQCGIEIDAYSDLLEYTPCGDFCNDCLAMHRKQCSEHKGD
jgi:hypothetical protein